MVNTTNPRTPDGGPSLWELIAATIGTAIGTLIFWASRF